MLDFILSKMNLLLLATAIFAIIAFFTVGLMERTTSNEAVLILDRLVKKSSAMANSSVYCDSFIFNLPNSIDVSGEHYYYVVKISKTQRTIEDEEFNQLIFSIIPRRDFRRNVNAPAIAAKSFLTKADLELYSFWDWKSESTPEFDFDPEKDLEYVFLDPQNSIPINSVYFVKEIFKGTPVFHVIPCQLRLEEIAKQKAAKVYYEDYPDVDRERFRC